MHKSIETAQKEASAQSAQSARSDEPMHRGDRSSSERAARRSTRPSTRRPRDGFRERRPDAASVVLAAGQHKHGRSNRLHQTCGPVNQQRHVCVEKCPLTMRHVAKRSGDSCGESQQSFGGIATWRPRRNNDLHAQWLEGTQVVLVSPANQPAQRRARAGELWRSVWKRTRGSARGRANSLSKQGIA